MKNYEAMSNFEINKWVWRLTKSPESMYVDSEFMRVFRDANEFYEFDPCNNPSDIMPIAIENKISIVFDGEFTGACNMPDKYQYPDNHNGSGNISVHCPENVLRAIAICLLKMKESQE